ncbi:hypothetical protein HQ447_16610 [bacterium]|nr:hypothetical protein [bacterium]
MRESIPLTSSARARSSLTVAERQAMFRLMSGHYEAVPEERFERDLAGKDEVLMLWDGQGSLRGFTTLVWNPAGRLEEGDILFSGDTIIDRSCWGTQELVRAFCRRAGEWQAASGRRLFWFLISKGHRTYLYLPLFARRFHPHPEHPEAEWAALAATVAACLFGDAWKPDEGLIRFPASHGHLREELAAGRGGNPWVRYFLQRNPGHAHGDELVCLTEMDETNLRRGALAAFRAGLS